MVKHLFSDIDGTLLQNHKIDETTLTKIKEFIAKGNKFYLASGRIDGDIKHLISNHLKVDVDYRISQNGTIVFNKNNEIIYTDYLEQTNLKPLVEYLFSLDSNKITIEVSSVHNRYLVKPRVGTYFAEFEDVSVVEPNLAEKIGNSILPTVILLLCYDVDYLKVVQDYVNKNFSNYTAVMTNTYLLEVLNKNSSKGKAIRSIVNKYNINPNDVYVVGDNENDVSMFNEFSNSFVMNTAKEHVKAQANFMVNLVGDVIDSIK